MRKYPVITLQGREDRKDPYCTAFAYTNQGNYLIRGYYSEIREHIKTSFKQCLYRMDMWKNGKNRGLWFLHLRSPYTGCVLNLTRDKKQRYRYQLLAYRENKPCIMLNFRNMPNKLPKEFQKLS